MDILIFKTNINCNEKLKTARQCLAQLVGIQEWSVDMNDCDCVLRIVAHNLSMNEVEQRVSAYGFEISALPD